MRPDQALNFCIGALRLDGHGADVLAVALAESAVDCLIADGFSRRALDAAIKILAEAMEERAEIFGAGARTGVLPRKCHIRVVARARD